MKLIKYKKKLTAWREYTNESNPASCPASLDFRLRPHNLEKMYLDMSLNEFTFVFLPALRSESYGPPKQTPV